MEFKGQYYNIPESKIGPKPIQKPNIPIYLGGFSPNTFARIVDYDTNGWLGLIGGPLDYLENTIKALKDKANKANKDQNSFKTNTFDLSKFNRIVFTIRYIECILSH